MKKRCCAGKSVCGKSPVDFLAFFLLLAATVFSQTNKRASLPVFAVEKFSTAPGNNKIAVLNIDNSAPYDLIFYGNNRNEFTYHSFKRLGKPKRKFFFYPLSEIKQIRYSKKNDLRHYIFVSRKSRIVGLASFTEYGTLRLLNKKRIADYPDKIIVGNFLGDPQMRALVFGENFQGVSLFTEKNLKLKETKVIERGTFSEGALIDADADGMNDLALYDKFANKINFYLNLLNKFEISFEETPENIIENVKTCDINGDKLMDYAFVSDGEIVANIVNSNPRNMLRLKTEAPRCVDFVFSDCTFDYKKDLIWANENGELFSNTETGGKSPQFSKPLHLTTIPDVSALSTVWNFDRRTIIALSSRGFFETFTPLEKIDTTISVLLPDYSAKAEPQIVSDKGEVKIFWLSETLPKLYSLRIAKTGKISAHETSLAFNPQNFIAGGENVFLLEDADSLVTLRRADIFGDAILSFPKKDFHSFRSEFFFTKNFAVNLTRPSDTLKVAFDFDRFIDANNDEFIFAKNDTLIFARVSSDKKMRTEKKIAFGNSGEIYPLHSQESEFFAIVIGRNEIDLIGKNRNLSFFYHNSSLSKKSLSFYLVMRDGKNFLLVTTATGVIYTAEIKESRNFLAFKKKKIAPRRGKIVKIGNKLFYASFNANLQSVDFTEIKIK